MGTAKEEYDKLRSLVDISYYIGQPAADLIDEAVSVAVPPPPEAQKAKADPKAK
jgi:hypothetical protein